MIGKQVLHYRILEKLGEGGMGVVYKAEDTKLKREVALKFLPRNTLTGKEENARFEHEAQAAARLDHPNICPIHEINEADGQKFIAMAYVEGQSLQEIVETQNLVSLRDVLDYCIQIAEGLQSAHEKGIVHRDIKPANILITEKRLVRITDFGLAKLAGRTQLTKEGASIGTVAYMSPEQTQGTEVDHRTDIWALGVVMYETVTGQIPFKGDYEQAVLYSILHEDPEPLTGLRTGVPMELERIVNKALTKNPDERYQQVNDILVDLKSLAKRLQAGASKSTQPVAVPRRRKPAVLYSAVIFCVILIIGGWIYFQQSVDQRSPENTKGQETTASTTTQWANSIAVLPFQNISPDPDQEYFCDGMTEQIITSLSQLGNLKVIARTSVMKFKDTKQTVPEIAAELQVANVLEGSIRKAGNRIRVTAQLIQADGGHHLWANDYDRELQDIFAVQDDVSQAIAGALLAELTQTSAEKIKNKQTKSAEAYQYYLQGEYVRRQYHFGTQNEANFKKSERLFKNAIALDPDYAVAYAGLANLYNSYDNLNQDEAKYVRLQQTYIDTAFNLDPNSAYVHEVKSYVHSYLNENDAAYESLKRALQINPNYRSSITAMGVFLQSRGLHQQAIKYFTKSMELDPLSRGGSGWRGISYASIGRIDQTRKDFKNDPDSFIGQGMMARLFISLKKYDQAEEFIVRRKEINPNHLSNNVEDALLYAAKGRRKEALQSLEQSNGAALKYDKLMIYSLLGMNDEVFKLLADKPYTDAITGRHVELDYLDMLHNPFLDNIRETKEFQAALQKAKEIYEEHLLKYAEVFL